MKNTHYAIVLTLLATLAWTHASSAATLVITDQSTWESRVLALTYAFHTEDFNDATLNKELRYKTGVGGVYEPDKGAGDDDGLWFDRVAKPTGDFVELTTTFEISGGAYAIGGTWDMTPAGHGSHIEITLLDAAGLEISSQEIPYLEGEFWGIISDEKFSSVRLSSYYGANDRIQETYTLENMVYSRGDLSLRQSSPTAVPLPAAFWLFTSSLLGLIGIGRWRSDSSPPRA